MSDECRTRSLVFGHEYELSTDERFVTNRLIVETEGAGWHRRVQLERAAGRSVVDDATIRYASGTFTADLRVDVDGFVTHYPAYAALAV
ncbi:MAG TPA: hypothetical protein VGP31_09250 [Planosporangium sp.]|nr:hypothetical protein [Planosporangium sp.]